MGPYTASSCCCQLSRVSSWVPVRLPLAASPSPHSANVPLSGLPHTAGGSIFCHRVLADYGPPIAAARPLILPWAPVPLLMLL
ncbi:unnamed protein product, partial [Staurois parvus]